MAERPNGTGITRQLARRLLPLSIGIGMSIAFATPIIYWVLEHRNLQHYATHYAEELALEFRDFAADAPALWEYQTYKFIAVRKGFHPTLDMEGFRVLDKKGEPISGYEWGDGIWQEGALNLAQELQHTIGTAPIFFNNRQVGTVEVCLSGINLLLTAAILFCASVAIGTILSVLVYHFPVRIVRRMEEHVRQTAEFAKTVLDSLNDAVAIVNAGVYRIVGCNAVFLYELGLSEAEVIGKTCYEVTHRRSDPCSPPDDICPLRETVTKRCHSIAEHIHFLKNGEKVDVEVSTTPIFDESGRVTQVVHVSRDITERKRSIEILAAQAEELAELALTDELTGLCNRRGFLNLAAQQLKLTDRFKKRMHLLFADLDGMKWINDNLGHGEGNLALKETAELLREVFRESDIIARLGGDEFAVLSMGTDKGGVKAIADRFTQQLDAHNRRTGRSYLLSVSIGVTVYDPTAPCSIEELLARGDSLMYEQKREKKQA